MLEVLHLLDDQQQVVVHRVIKNSQPSTDDFCSAFVLRSPPARRIQRRSAPVWMAISTLGTLAAARSRAQLFPRLGSHVARLELIGGHGFAVAETVQPGHFSIWGEPESLETAVIQVYPAT